MSKVMISPSILSADFAFMGENAIMLKKNGADMIHCDVMDGVFVPNITFGMKMISDLKPMVNIPLDVHLMIVNPETYVEKFILAGADYLTVHLEATENPAKTLKQIRSLGAKAGICIKPMTPASELQEYIDLVDLILIMSVEPGFGGQKFMPIALEKIANVKKMIGERNIVLEVDGGINAENAAACVSAGANCLVAGNAIFKAEDKAATIRALKGD
ncbi:MAG TPA: ribulose-phosphate 3-epimerase [Eubacteriales bacterium]|nr:ribulose-phosphate 3-epimerase [Eubacteriales bacterium]